VIGGLLIGKAID